MQRICNMPCPRLWSPPRGSAERRVSAIGWGLFLIWVGIAILFDAGWGVGLLGIGVLTLLMQVVRHRIGLRIEGFWLLAGAVFAAAGLWELATAAVELGPIALVALGVAVLVSVLFVKSE